MLHSVVNNYLSMGLPDSTFALYLSGKPMRIDTYIVTMTANLTVLIII